MPEAKLETFAEQNKLSLTVSAFLKGHSVVEWEGPQQAYVEFAYWPDDPARRDPRKEKMLRMIYVTLTNGGRKKEGEEFPLFSPTADAAVDGYLAHLKLYLGGCRNIFWRLRPTIEADSERFDQPDRWIVYSRLIAYT